MHSRIETGTLYSDYLKIDWNYDVYLPKSYSTQTDKKYPVVYLLHGLGGNHTNMLEKLPSQELLDNLSVELSQEIIAVFVDGFNSFYIDAENNGLQVESALMREMVPFIDKNYRIVNDPTKRAIGGISMGGYGAARLSLKYPQYWGKAVLLSPAVFYDLSEDNHFKKTLHAFQKGKIAWSDEFYNQVFPTNYISPDSQNVQFYLETTTADSQVPFFGIERFVNELKNAKLTVKYVVDHGDDHNWIYWNKVAPRAYQWLLEEFKKE